MNSIIKKISEGTNTMDSSVLYKYCIDCGKQLNKDSKNNKTLRCCSCNIKFFHKIKIIDIYKINKKRAKDKKENRIRNCVVCGKLLSKDSYYRNTNKCRRHSRIGTRLSEKTKRKMSLSKKGKYTGRNNHRFGKISHGKGSYYKDIYMRSSWEVAYAKYLDKNKIKWLYESKTFDLGDTTYTPDFYLPETNEYIEIKGYWRDDAKDKLNVFKQIYRNYDLIILEKLELKKLGVI